MLNLIFRNKWWARICSTILVVATTGRAVGANVAWSTTENISGDSDVVTTGRLVAAYNFGSPSVPTVTINSVTFDAFPIPGGTRSVASGMLTVGDPTLTSLNILTGSTSQGSANPPFSNLSNEYKAMLGEAVQEDIGNRIIEFTFSDLTIGSEYLIQLWVNHSLFTRNGDQFVFDMFPMSNDVRLIANTSNAIGGTGQFVVGTFVADATSKTIFVNAGQFPYLNGLQLRNLSIPEPSTLLLLAMAATAVSFSQRDRNRQ